MDPISISAGMSPPRVLPLASELFRDSLSFLAAHWRVLWGILAAPLIINILQSLFGGLSLFLLPATLLLFLIGFFSQLALFQAIVEKGEPKGGVLGAYERGIPLFFSYLWVSILGTLAILGGFLLFIIPGILISISTSFALFVLFVEGRKGTAALAASWFYVKGRWWGVFWRFLFLGAAALVVYGSIIVLLFVLGFGSGFSGIARPSTLLIMFEKVWSLATIFLNELIILPFGSIYTYFLYQALRAVKSGSSAEEEILRHKNKIAVFAVFGIVAIIVLLAGVGFILWKAITDWIPGPPRSLPE